MHKLTIGMPTYNSSDFLEESISSLLRQNFKDFKLIISDDASTDSTPEICQYWAKQDSRIEFIKQKTNLGPKSNFQYLLDRADSEYFMWASHDDLWSPDFVKKCIAKLEEDISAGFVITKWIIESRQTPLIRRFFLPNMSFVSHSDPIQRMMKFTALPFSSFKDNLTYGVWRKKALKKIMSETRQLNYFSIGAAINEYALLCYKGLYVGSVSLRKRYRYIPPGGILDKIYEALIKLKTSSNPLPPLPYTADDHILELKAVLELAKLEKPIIDKAIHLNRMHLFGGR